MQMNSILANFDTLWSPIGEVTCTCNDNYNLFAVPTIK